MTDSLEAGTVEATAEAAADRTDRSRWAALVAGYRRGFVVGTALVLVALGVTLAVIRNPRTPDAEVIVLDDTDGDQAVPADLAAA